MSTATLVMQIGAAIFALATIYFLLSGKEKPGFGTEFFISFITTTSYTLMSVGIATVTSADGQIIYWSRWLFYMIACSLLMYDTAKALKIPDNKYPWMVLLTWLTMFNGFLSSYIVTSERWMFYILGSVAFIGILYMVLQGEENPDFKSLKYFVLVGWTLFPAIFIIAPTGLGVLDTATSEAGYLILDFLTKIVYGFYTIKLK